jgi:hypothetical protein
MRRSTEFQMRRWAAIRERGMVWFLLVHGALGWGLSVALLSFLVDWTWYGLTVSAALRPGWILRYMVGGLLWGYAVWLCLESQYRAYLSGGEPGP